MSDGKRKRPRWVWALRLLLILLVGYVILVTYFVMAEDAIVFQPYSAAEYWEPKPGPSVEDVWMDLPTGETIHGWWCPQPDSEDAVLVCHGNGGNLSNRGERIAAFGERIGRSMLIIDYPGYGKSTGDPSEEGCYAAAERACRWLREEGEIPIGRIAAYGESLGGAVAVELATREDIGALVLVKTFTSAPAMAEEWYPFLPSHWLMSNRFDSIAKIALVDEPVMIAGGTKDTVVPFAHSEELFERANEPKALFRLEGSDHVHPIPEEFMERLDAFLDEHLGQR